MPWLTSRNISRGWSDGTFRPLETVNRDAMAAFLYRFVETTRIYEGSPEDPRLFVDSEVGGFLDVPVGTQFRREIAWAASAGIATGWGGSQFAPLSPVNRDAMAAFLFRTIADSQTGNTVYEPTATAAQRGGRAGAVRMPRRSGQPAVSGASSYRSPDRKPGPLTMRDVKQSQTKQPRYPVHATSTDLFNCADLRAGDATAAVRIATRIGSAT
jgi:S-layer homology domain